GVERGVERRAPGARPGAVPDGPAAGAARADGSGRSHRYRRGPPARWLPGPRPRPDAATRRGDRGDPAGWAKRPGRRVLPDRREVGGLPWGRAAAPLPGGECRGRRAWRL